MSTLAQEELARLRSFAARRLANPHGQQLAAFLDEPGWERALVDRPLVPWAMSLGFSTDHWSTFSDAQRLALNHWTYAMMYFRIGDGERFVIASNEVVAEVLDELDPVIAGLLRLETDEERDHLVAFGRVFAALQARHHFSASRMPVKPLRPLFVSRPFIRFLVGTFGADFVVTYYLGRGLVNHMGKAFETKVAAFDEAGPALARLSMLHTVDENRHMAVSRMMAACAFELIERQASVNALSEALTQLMQRSVVRYTFSDAITTGQERAMSHAVVPSIAALATVPKETLRACIDAHFDGVTGIEEAKNAFMPAFNRRLLERACLSPADKRRWFELLQSLQRNLQFFPPGWQPGDALGPELDDERNALIFDDAPAHR